MSESPVISIVDDDFSLRDALSSLIRSIGFIAEPFHSAEDFLRCGGHSRASCLIADMRMSGMSGLELQNHLVAAGTPIPTILITAFPNQRDRERAKKSGIIGYLAKPFAEFELLACIDVSLAASGSGTKR